MDMASIDDLQKEKGKKGAKGVNASLATPNETYPMCGHDLLYAARQYADKRAQRSA
jgi:hypothetical protein